MSIIYILIPLAIIIVCLAIGIFFWAVKSNQFDDLERHGYSILFDDDIKPADPATSESLEGKDHKAKPQKAEPDTNRDNNDQL